MKNPFTDSKALWTYVHRFQPVFELALSYFGYEDALIAISCKVTEGDPAPGPMIEPLGNEWVFNHGRQMEGRPEDYVQTAETLTNIVAIKNCASDSTDLTNSKVVGYGTINSDGWIVVVTGPETAVCEFITITVMDAIECYIKVAAAKSAGG